MKVLLFIIVFFVLLIQKAKAIPVAIVSHHWVTKIIDSRNNVTIRPGSVYDIRTYFEQIFKGKRPKFKYIFRDTGLGAAEPIYPIFQKGYQKSWRQVIKGGISKKHLHIDHYSQVDVPEGCRVYSAYWVRHVNDYPEIYAKEKKEGYTLIDIGFDYYEQLRDNVRCGKHISYPPLPKEKNPIRLLKKYAKKFTKYEDLPPELLAKLETKIGVLKLVTEKFSRKKWPRYDKVYSLKANSMWYYLGDELNRDYGLTATYSSRNGKGQLNKASDYFLAASDELKKSVTVDKLLTPHEVNVLFEHLDGRPVEGGQNKQREPGSDLFSLKQVTRKNIWTAGLKLWPIENVQKIVHDLKNYKLVSLVVRPYEPETDIAFKERIVPQLRFVFQIEHPMNKIPVEQVFLHIQFDAVDRYAEKSMRDVQHLKFLKDYENLIDIKKNRPLFFDREALAFITRYTKQKVMTVAYSSSLTGIWVFGAVGRAFNVSRGFEAIRFKRASIDVGYYSTIWDNELFRDKIKETKDEESRKSLQGHMALLTPLTYRDEKRQDVANITFNKMTCAQCHQMAGRDGVHIAFNDYTDKRLQSPTRITEFALKEVDRQLKFGESYWAK